MTECNVGHNRLMVVLCVLTPGLLAAAAQSTDSAVATYVAEARAIALTDYDVELRLDTRDIDGVARILDRIRSRHIQTPLSPKALAVEVQLWGAALGEILRSKWKKAHWGPSKEHNRAYSFSVYVPLEGGGWLESNEFDLVEGFITKPSSQLTIQQALTLHFLE